MTPSSHRHRISAAIITLNEEKTLERCLRSIAWVDEIIVVDAKSTDRTREIAQKADAPWAGRLRFVENAWPGFNRQRTLAMETAANDWILVMDADEACSPELQKRIEGLLSEENPHRAWKIRRQEYFLGKPVHFGVWNPSYQDRFFNRSGVRYQNEIHEYPLFPVEARRIHEPIHHWPDFDIETFLGKMNKYTTIEAHDRVAAGQRTNAFRMLFTGPAMFLKNYFYYRSYRDGMRGFVISILEGISRAARHAKMWREQQRLSGSK